MVYVAGFCLEYAAAENKELYDHYEVIKENLSSLMKHFDAYD